MRRSTKRTSLKTKTQLLRNVDVPSILKPAGNQHRAATKVVITLGPASRDVSTLCQLLEEGATCARVDLTWGTLEYHQQSLRNLEEAVRRCRVMCAIVVDTLGRELMIRRPFSLNEDGWPVHNQPLDVKANQEIVVSADPNATASNTCLPITCPLFATMVRPGDKLIVGRYLESGADQSSLFLEVREVRGDEVVCIAQNDATPDGLLTVLHAGNINDDSEYNVQSSLPMLSEHDSKAISLLSKEFEIDFVALTYVMSGSDVAEMRDFLDSIGLEHTKILAKVENKAALHAFEGIAAAADGVIMSRGNLGLDVAPEKLAIVQKALISHCNVLGKPILLTRFVDSMASGPRPTRAEATDVANAVLDGLDGILLGAETLRGKYPLETVRTVLNICKQAELVFDHVHHFEFLMNEALEEQGRMSSQMELTRFHDPLVPDGSSMAASFDDLPSLAPPNGAAPPPPQRVSSHPHLPKAVQGLRTSGDIPGLGHKMGSMSRVSSFGSLPRLPSQHFMRGTRSSANLPDTGSPYFSKVEAIASTAVRAADKIQAGLIVCYAHTGRTASLVAKYRPTMPIMALVVPEVKATTVGRWDLRGRLLARQFLIVRGIVPVLAAPTSGESDAMLGGVLDGAVSRGLVAADQYVVCVQSQKDNVMLKVLKVDEAGGPKTGRERLPSTGHLSISPERPH